MGLRTKIFISFSILLLMLLGGVQYITNVKTEAFEVAGITHQLMAASDRFRKRLENQRQGTFRLVSAITTGQKYRAFLQQIKENFFSFAEELAFDTGADHVLMVDEKMALRGVSPPIKRGDDAEAHAERMSKIVKAAHLRTIFERVLDTGLGENRVVAFAGGLANASFVPLKESLRDDYALGVVLVAEPIDDNWIRALLGDEVDDLKVAFFVEGKPVASNASKRNRRRLVDVRTPAGAAVTEIRLRGERHLVLTTLFQETGAKSGYVVAANLDRSLQPIAAMQRTILLIGGGVLILGLLMTLAVASGIVRPLRRLVDGTHRVVEGDYTFQVENAGKDEVGELSSAFQKMVEGLQEKENIRSLFGKYVHPSIVSDLLEDPDNVVVGGNRQVQTLLFGDVENFVGLSSGMNAEALVEFLNGYLGAMTEELTRSEGILDKYLGDGLMAFFGPPFTPGNHALAGCVAALRMQSRLKELAAGWHAEGLPPIRVRIGVSTGEVVVGNIGSEHMRDYTCIGEAVNMASRLENLNRHYGTSIIIDAATREMAGRSVMVRELDTVRVVGSDLDSHLYELISLAGEQDADTAELIERYGVALGDYRAGRFGRAGRHFEVLIKPPFDDAPSRVMAARCLELKQNPRQGWDGVHEMLEK